jgi:PHS family inorganic phosphate transporter-like MFS transporter
VVIGQLSFGLLADTLGRKTASLFTATLTIIGAVLSGCVQDTNGSGWDICGQLGLARFLLGLGIGGEYPLSAALSQELEGSALCLSRSQLLCLNIAFFNVGMLCQAVLVLTLISYQVSLATTWRLAFIWPGAVLGGDLPAPGNEGAQG